MGGEKVAACTTATVLHRPLHPSPCHSLRSRTVQLLPQQERDALLPLLEEFRAAGRKQLTILLLGGLRAVRCGCKMRYRGIPDTRLEQ